MNESASELILDRCGGDEGDRGSKQNSAFT